MVSSYVEILKRYSASLATWLVHMLKFSEVSASLATCLVHMLKFSEVFSKFDNMVSSYGEILIGIQQVWQHG